MKIKKNAFTLIELLAVIVILAIIALIATPIILGIINDAKKSAAELSLKNYIKAVELAISNKYVKDPTVDLNGICEVIENGNKIECGTGVPIEIEYNGEGLIEGIIELKEGIVTRVLDGKLKGISEDIELNNGQISSASEVEKSILITGSKFNAALKNLANGTTDMKYNTEDNSIISIEFYSRGLLPSGYTQEKLNLLPHISVSDNNDIIAYNDSGKVYIVSNNLVDFNKDSSYMFYQFKALKQIKFRIINTSDVTSMRNMFDGCSSLVKLDLSKFDTYNVQYMYAMFWGCSSLKGLDLSKWNTSNVTEMSYMFVYCNKLESINLNKWNTGNVNTMQNMFHGCSSLTSLDLSSFKTHNVTTMLYMFHGCSSLTSLDLSNFNTSNVTNMQEMFYGCSNLTSLDLSNFNTSSVTNMGGMFYNTTNLKPIFVGENWVIGDSTGTANMFYKSKTTKLEELCEPNSTEEWCVVNN